MNTNQLNRVAEQPKFSQAVTSAAYQKVIKNTLGDPNRCERFVASITSAVATNPDLQSCTPDSILAGALLGETLNLSPSPQLGQFYLVPFNQKEKRDRDGNLVQRACRKAQFILGYKGYYQLAVRSGQYTDIGTMEIREGEYKGKDRLTGKPKFEFIEDDDLRESLPVIGYMAYIELTTGFKKSIYWSKEKMLNHADSFSAAFSKAAYKKLEAGEIPERDMWRYSSFWYKNFDEMAFKTLVKQIITKWGVMSIDLNTAAAVADGAVATVEDGGVIWESSLPEPEPVTAIPEPEAEEASEVAAEELDIEEL